jgi:hypothetical protein
VATTIFLLNRAQTKVLNGNTSFESYHDRKLAVVFLKTFGCVGFIKNKSSRLKKLDDRSAPMVFIGYSEGAKAYRMWDLGTGCVHVSRDVIFDENGGWEWDSTASRDSAVQQEFTVCFYTAQVLVDEVDGGVLEEDAPPPPSGQEVPLPDPATPPPMGQQAPKFVMPIEDDEDSLDAFHNESPIHYR